MKNSRVVRIAVVFLSAIGVVTAAACGSSSTAPDTTAANAAVAGTYTLKTVDGVTLPAPAKDDKGTVAGTLTSGTVTLASSGTFSSNVSYTLTSGTAGTSTSSGTYTVSGNSVTFVVSGSPNSTAAFSGGNTLTVVNNTQTFVYTK